METMIQTPEFDRLAFTVLAIEVSIMEQNSTYHCAVS